MTKIVISGGTTSWIVPSDWDNSKNTISLLAPGVNGFSTGGAARGGAGGSLPIFTGATLAPGATLTSGFSGTTTSLSYPGKFFISMGNVLGSTSDPWGNVFISGSAPPTLSTGFNGGNGATTSGGGGGGAASVLGNGASATGTQVNGANAGTGGGVGGVGAASNGAAGTDFDGTVGSGGGGAGGTTKGGNGGNFGAGGGGFSTKGGTAGVAGGGAIFIDYTPASSGSYTYTPSGGALIAGTAPIEVGLIFTGTGGLQTGGGADLSFGKIYEPSGGLLIAGDATVSTGSSHTVVPTGGLLLAGEAGVFVGKSWEPSGGLVIAGDAQIAVGNSVVGSGGLVIGGSADAATGWIFEPSGGLVFGGDADCVLDAVSTSGVGYYSGKPVRKKRTILRIHRNEPEAEQEIEAAEVVAVSVANIAQKVDFVEQIKAQAKQAQAVSYDEEDEELLMLF